MTYYVDLSPMQEPFDLGQDAAGRIMLAFNVMAECQWTAAFDYDLVELLENAGVGTFSLNMFASTAAVVPQGEGPFLIILRSGGGAPSRTQNEINPPAYIRPSAQIKCIGRDYEATLQMTLDAYLALNIRNTDVGSIPEHSMGVITARQGRMRARLIGDTTDATPTDLLVNGQTGLLIEAGVTAAFFVRIVGRAPGGAMVGHYTIEGLISNNAGTTAIQGDLERTTKYEAAAGLQTDALADNTNDALIVRVTGLAATTIHWEADVAIQRSIA